MVEYADVDSIIERLRKSDYGTLEERYMQDIWQIIYNINIHSLGELEPFGFLRDIVMSKELLVEKYKKKNFQSFN